MAKGLFRSTTIFSSMTFLSRIMGFLRDMIVAHIFGASGLTDAFYVAFKIPNFMRRLFAEGAFSQAFVPVLAHYKEKEDHASLRRFIDHVSGTLGLVLAIVTILGILLAPLVIDLFAPGFDKDATRYALSVDMLRITFPYILFISLTALASGVLNTHNHFAGPAFTPVLLNIAMILAAVYLAPHMKDPIVALAWGVFIAGILQLIFQYPFLRRLKLIPRFIPSFKHPGVRRVLRLMLPALFGVSVYQIGLVVDTIFASFLHEGSISWLYNSERVMEFPLGMLGAGLSTVVLPHLSKCFAKNSHEEFSHTIEWALRLTLLLGLPSMLVLIFLDVPIVSTLFHYGKFDASDVLMTARALLAYAFGVPFMILLKIMASGFYSRQDIKTPVRIAVLALIVNVVFNFILIYPLQHAGLALASTLGAVFNSLCLLYLLVKRNIYLPSPSLRRFSGRVFLANVGFALLIFFIKASDSAWLVWSWQQRFSHLFLILAVGALVYSAILWLSGLRLHDFSSKGF